MPRGGNRKNYTYDPTPEEIAAGALEVQATWSALDRRRRDVSKSGGRVEATCYQSRRRGRDVTYER